MSININITPLNSGTLSVDGTAQPNITVSVTGGIGPPGTDVALAAGSGISITQANNTATISSTLAIPDNLADLSDVAFGNVTSGQVLAYNGTAWTAATDNALTLSTSAGSDLGAAAIGTSGEAARADHVHNLPTFAEITNGTATVTGNLTLNASTGSVILNGGTAGSASLTLNCEQNTHGVTIQGPPHSAAATYTLTLPTSDGAANQVLQTDGNGSLSWADQSAGGVTWAAEPAASNSNGTAGQIAYGSGFFYLHDGTEWRRAALSTFGTSTPTITITTQPQNLTLADGGSGSFTIAATVSDGSTPSYQWQNSDDSGATWDTLTGSTGTTYSLSGVSTLDNGTQYRAIVSASGASDVMSSVATLTVTAATETFDLLTEASDRLMTETGDSLDHDGVGGGGNLSGWVQVNSIIPGPAAGDLLGEHVTLSQNGSEVLAITNRSSGSQNAVVYANAGSGWSSLSVLPGIGPGDAAISAGGDVVVLADATTQSSDGILRFKAFALTGGQWLQKGTTVDFYQTTEALVDIGDSGNLAVVLKGHSGGAERLSTRRYQEEFDGFDWRDGLWHDYNALDVRPAVASGAAVFAYCTLEYVNEGEGTVVYNAIRCQTLSPSIAQLGGYIRRSALAIGMNSNGTLLAVAAKASAGQTTSNAVAVYEYDGTDWSQRGADIGISGVTSVSLSDSGLLAIGKPAASDGGTENGLAQVYEWNGTAWNQYGGNITGDSNFDLLGISVDISGDGTRLAVGATGEDAGGSNSGGVKVYQYY